MVANLIGNAIGGVLGTVGTIFGAHKAAEDSSALQYKYQEKLNKTNYKRNVKLINLQNAFNEKMMDKANAFNESMWNASVDLSNTAHQREVADLRAAGLNPVLSANGGATTVNPIQSAQTSSGNSQLSSSAGLPDVDYLSAVNTAFNMRNQSKLTENELLNSKTNRSYTKAQEDNVYNQIDINNKNSASEIKKRDAEIDEIRQNIKNSKLITNAQVKNLVSQANLNNQNSAKSQSEISNLEYIKEENKRQADWIKNHPKQAQWTRTIGEWTGAFGKVFSGGVSAGYSNSHVHK